VIVDAHTHIFEAGRGGPLGLPASADDLVRQMDEHEVDVSVVLPVAGAACNEFVQQQCARFPDRLVGLYNPDFEDPRRTIAAMEAFFEAHSPPGLKLHPRLQGVTVKDAVVREVLAFAVERKLAVIVDAFLFGPRLDDPDLRPAAYHRLAQEMPELRLVLAHAGGHLVLEAFLAAKANPNLFLDVSFTPVYFRGASVADDVAFACRRLPAGRVLYGSDFPHVPFGESLRAAREWTAPHDDAACRELFGDAAVRLFRIGQRSA
jgi:predicted TIM-barrel fold metal-dependent hydrolase